MRSEINIQDYESIFVPNIKEVLIYFPVRLIFGTLLFIEIEKINYEKT